MNKPSKAPSKKKLSVGFVFDDSLDSTDGVAQYVKTLGGWLSGRGHKVCYLVGESDMKKWRGGRVYSLSKNVSVSFNANRVSSPRPASAKTIKTILDKEEVDVLHVQVPYSPLMAQKVINSADDATAVIGTFHIMPSGKAARIGTKLLRPAYGRSLGRFDSFLSVSQPAAKFAKQALGVASVVVPNVVDIPKFRATAKRVQGKNIVFLGRLVKRKGVMHLLRAFDILSRMEPEAQLVIAGKGPLEKRLKRYVKSKKLSGRVTFTGYIPESEKARLLHSADIACFPATTGESFGIVLIESMAAGSGPVLGGDNPGYRSVLGPQPKLLIEPKSSVQFAIRMKKLLTNKALNSELRLWQAQYVKQFDVANVGPKIEAQYLRAIAKRKQKGNN